MIRPKNIAITYANDYQMDGSGAQLQRVYGVWAISRLVGISYIHSEIKSLGYQGLQSLELAGPIPGLEARYNATFKIQSDIEFPIDAKVYSCPRPDLMELQSVVERAATNGKPSIIKVAYPYAIADRIPQIYSRVRTISPFINAQEGLFRIAIHVRRGELVVVESDRMLPNSYYISVAQRVIAQLIRQSIPFVCELHTEVPNNAFTITKEQFGIDYRISNNTLITPDQNKIQDFDILPNLRHHINEDQIHTLESLSTADLLIMSRSSFSYVAAILNVHGIVIYHPFWHSQVPDWLNALDHQAKFERELAEKITDWQNHESRSTIELNDKQDFINLRDESGAISTIPRIVVGICSCRKNAALRQAIRDTWLQNCPENIKIWFYVGMGSDERLEADTLLLEAEDDYSHLPSKVISFFKYALEMWDFDYIFKCDDDTFVALDRLSELTVCQADLIGNRDVGLRGSPGGGAGYFLSRRILKKIVEDYTIPNEGFEDILIGDAAIRHGGIPYATNLLQMDSKQPPQPDNQFVTAHYCSVTLHRLFYNLMNRIGSVARMTHPTWKDSIVLSEDGIFHRFNTKCAGHWEFTKDGLLRLSWFEWPVEEFRPLNQCTPPKFLGDFCGEYQLATAS